MQITIDISSEVTDGKREVHWNGELSHHIDDSDIKTTLDDARTQAWKSRQDTGVILGARLYDMLNGSGANLTAAVNTARAKGEPLSIHLHLPFEIDALPVELLNRNGFLLLERQTAIHLIRRVTDRNRRKEERAERRTLKLLFMACSPTNLADSTLAFEAEEERILREVEKFPVDMRIEDSGSLKGLADTLYEGDGYDIVHITGHAGVDPKLGPVFYMEDEVGELEKATPEMLWENLRDFSPKLLFLSGCSTGTSDKLNASESFAYRMVEEGIPIVLGWGLPVSDAAATALTAELYRHLAMGKDVDEAVQRARQLMEDRYHPWPLLRVFTDASPLKPLIAAGQKLRHQTARTTTYKTLQDSDVQVLETGFVGRRREIQTGVRVLKGADEKYGILIRGPAGVGKSCLAGKLIERFGEKELIVLRGELKRMDLLVKLRRMFDRMGIADGVEIIGAEMEFDEKIKELFRGPLAKHPTLIYLDDFEQNLQRRGDEHYLTENAVEIMKPLLTALDWAEGETNLLITSRHPFVLEAEGENLPAEKLADISLASFRGPDLDKKRAGLKSIAASDHSDLYMEFGKGNPRLLDWLEVIAAEEAKYDLDGLRAALRGKTEDYIREYLADLMAKTQGADFHRFLQRASVFRQPVAENAFAPMGTEALLRRGVDLTLIEREGRGGTTAAYWVAPILREGQWAKLEDTEKTEMHRHAYRWYDERIEGSDEPAAEHLEEAIHHALAAGNIRGACKHAITLGIHLRDLLLYRERLQLQQSVIDRITEAVIAEAMAEKDENVATLLGNQGTAVYTLGDARQAIAFFEQALRIFRAVYGENHPSVATSYNNIGEAWRVLADAQKAIGYLQQALDINLSVYGENHPSVATSYNNIGEAWRDLGDAQKAIGYYQLALDIDLSVYGENHPSVAISYNNIGEAWQALGDAQKAIGYLQLALEIDRTVYGENHPNVAIRYNNIGGAWRVLGDAQKAIDYYQRAVEIFRAVYGENHPNVATSYNNVGQAWRVLGDARQAIGYYQRALDIWMEVYGPDHPHTRSVQENIEVVRSGGS